MTAALGQVEVRCLRLSQVDPHELEDGLHEAESARAARFLKPADRDRFRLGRRLLRQMLGEALARPPASFAFVADANGEPMLSEPSPLAFNLAHSGDLVLVALGEAAGIGIDVERHREDFDALALGSRAFTPTELASIRCCRPADRPSAFLDLWVLKEALLKGIGTGFLRDPREVEIATGAEGPCAASPAGARPDPVARWTLRRHSVPPGYHAALAVLPRP